MKRKFLPFLMLLLFCSFFRIALAAGPAEPIINSQYPDCSMPAGSELTLYADASSPDGGTLVYQWYSTTVNDMATIRAIIGAEGESYRVPDFSGTQWFCYAVWNVNSNGEKSTPVYSRLIRVEFYESVTVVGLEIQEIPKKVVYAPGECLDLTGLKVRVYTSEGYIDSLDGDRLEITKNPLYTLGEQKIKVSYGEVFDFFIVTVEEPEPAYSIEIQKQPDKLVYTSGECLDLTGMKVRVYTPDGYFDSVNGEKLEITKAPLITVGYQKIKVAYKDAFEVFLVEVKEASHTHSFGEWMVLTEPSCTEDGIRLRECGCGVEEREDIPATGHSWDEGKITVEATAEHDGEKTFVCTVCNETKTEVIKAGEGSGEGIGEGIGEGENEDTGENAPTEAPGNETPNGESNETGKGQSSKSESDADFPWWILAIVVILIGAGVTVFVIYKRKR